MNNIITAQKTETCHIMIVVIKIQLYQRYSVKKEKKKKILETKYETNLLIT